MGANAPAALRDKGPVWVCPNRGHYGWPARFTRGSLLVELPQWLFFVLPDVIYSAWRLTTRFRGCASSSQPGVVGAPTSRALQLMQQYRLCREKALWPSSLAR